MQVLARGREHRTWLVAGVVRRRPGCSNPPGIWIPALLLLHKNTCEIPPGPLAAGATVTVPVSNGVALSNRGGSITVLDDTGRKVSGVSYTAEAAQREGWMVTF